MVTPEGKNSRKNILFFKKFEESLIKVSERTEKKMALVVKGLGSPITTAQVMVIEGLGCPKTTAQVMVTEG